MSTVQFSVPERAALLALMTFVDKVPNTDLRSRYGFAIEGRLRRRLERDGYVECKRADGVPGRPFVTQLTDKGWRWCREELGQAPLATDPRPYRLLYGVLNNLDRYMDVSQLAMADVFATDPPSTSLAADLPTAETRIRAAYADLVATPTGWVGLRRLRERLADLSRADMDAALLRLDLQPGIYLQPEPNQKTLSDADWEAAIRIGGESKHLLSIEGS